MDKNTMYLKYDLLRKQNKQLSIGYFMSWVGDQCGFPL